MQKNWGKGGKRRENCRKIVELVEKVHRNSHPPGCCLSPPRAQIQGGGGHRDKNGTRLRWPKKPFYAGFSPQPGKGARWSILRWGVYNLRFGVGIKILTCLLKFCSSVKQNFIEKLGDNEHQAQFSEAPNVPGEHRNILN